MLKAFLKWFVAEKATEIKENMLSCLREAAGLGSLPSSFNANICECLNSVLHEAMQELVKQSYQLAVTDSGDFGFKHQYQAFGCFPGLLVLNNYHTTSKSSRKLNIKIIWVKFHLLHLYSQMTQVLYLPSQMMSEVQKVYKKV